MKFATFLKSGLAVWRDVVQLVCTCSDHGIRVAFETPAYVGRGFTSRLNIIAPYMERILSTSTDGHDPLK
jgi:hypothetical protein